MTRQVKLNIPELIEEYLFSKNDGDKDECRDIKERFDKMYAECTPETQESMREYIANYLTTKQLSHGRDLDNLFGEL